MKHLWKKAAQGFRKSLQQTFLSDEKIRKLDGR